MGAWHPFTGRGIAAFANASGARISVVLAVAASLVGAVVTWALSVAWFPVVERGIQSLPPSAGIRSSRLLWPDPQTRRLAEGPALDWVIRPVAPTGPDPLGQTSDLRVEFRSRSLRLQGSLGHLEFPYPASWDLPLGRIPAMAGWKAWKPYVSFVGSLGLALALLAAWMILACAYCIPAWVFARVVAKRPSLAESWRMGAAALLMGAVVAAIGIAAYATGVIRVPGLLVSQALHVPVPWLWLAWGILSLDRGGRPAKRSSKTYR